ncbi:MAG: SRPBCC domain-containing protein [Acidimicrobiia bacterium]|nr:SRPBCC domain-containing protein [Acidimicrobiia bacterium]
MTPTVTTDRDSATFTVAAVYEAPTERIWRLWSDPRQLERWWGPPSHPATVVHHDLTAGGVVSYYMTSPEGEKFHGGWRVLGVEAPNLLEFEDYFANQDGSENVDLPISRSTVAIEDQGDGRTRMTITTRYENSAAMEKVLEMGMEEGITSALGQIEEILAEDRSRSSN